MIITSVVTREWCSCAFSEAVSSLGLSGIMSLKEKQLSAIKAVYEGHRIMFEFRVRIVP